VSRSRCDSPPLPPPARDAHPTCFAIAPQAPDPAPEPLSGPQSLFDLLYSAGQPFPVGAAPFGAAHLHSTVPPGTSEGQPRSVSATPTTSASSSGTTATTVSGTAPSGAHVTTPTAAIPAAAGAGAAGEGGGEGEGSSAASGGAAGGAGSGGGGGDSTALWSHPYADRQATFRAPSVKMYMQQTLYAGLGSAIVVDFNA